MRFLSLTILAVCILLPPLFYIYSIQLLEGYLKAAYTEEVEEIYIGDTGKLFNGSVSLRKAINENIAAFFGQKRLPPWGVKVGVVVMTKGNWLDTKGRR